MHSRPPDPDGLDSGWESEGSEDESTQLIDSKELFERAGFRMDQPGVEGRARTAGRGRGEGRITARAPTDEYADHVNKARPSSQGLAAVQGPGAPAVGDTYEETLDALLKDQSSALECDEPGIASGPGGGLAFEPSPGIRDPLSDALFSRIDSPYPSSAACVEEPGPDPDAAPDLQLDLDMPDLDLGLEAAALDRGTQPPITPPPGTLRFGLIEDDSDTPRSSQDWLDLAGEAVTQPRGASQPTSAPGSTEPARAAAPHTSTLVPGSRTLVPGSRPSSPGCSPRPPPSGDRRRQMLQRFEAGDYGGALVLAEAILDETPDDGIAQRYAESCNEMLRQMYKARIGDGSQVLRILVSPEEIRSLSLDHRAGFLLSCIDGMSSIDDVLDVSGMGELEALRILFELVQENIIAPCDDPR